MSQNKSPLQFDSRVQHADGHEKPLMSHSWPIFQTSTFRFSSPDQGRKLFQGEETGHIYSRVGNPTVEAFERVVTSLEEGYDSVAFGSGMAAIFASTATFLNNGDHMLADNTLYGGSVSLFTSRYARFGFEVQTIDTSDINEVRKAIKKSTKMIVFESPANPTMKVIDIRAISNLAHEHGMLVIVDNTFSSPYNQQPLKHGADIVAHSLTKYMNGHGDVVGGVVVTSNKEQSEQLRIFRRETGGIMGPFDAWLVLRGLRTLPVRMRAHNENGKKVAEFLRKQKSVSRVLYPGFEDYPGHDIMKKQIRPGVVDGYGSTFSFEMAGGFKSAKRMLEAISGSLKMKNGEKMGPVETMTLAVSLGNTDTLIEHPASMTHSGLNEEQLRATGLSPGLIRISVGLEAIEDLLSDLEWSLKMAEQIGDE